jgi:AraC-like DNA-binding protein
MALIPPEEVHCCNPGSESPWSYLLFHLSDRLFRKAFEDLLGKHSCDPVFPSPVVSDPKIHCLMVGLFELVKNGATRLEKEEALFTFLQELLLRHTNLAGEKLPETHEPGTVRLIKGYLANNLEKNISMDELSDITGVSVYHMLSVFRRTVGIPPHAYQIQMRIKEARKLLLKGYSIVDAALATGFYDQSHFTKKFKPSVGITPSRYIRAHRSS